jgi:pantoate--beta-alanine ligase
MEPEVVETIADLRARLAARRLRGESIGFVPTMGALHAGHASLLARGRRDTSAVVASIFVNPLQFDRPDDLARYPRTLAADLEVCRGEGVDIVFAPSVAEMYPVEPVCAVDVGALGEHLCGKYRPGHFRGVATAVLKLLQIVAPDVAYFGEKDAQQLAVVRRLVEDFNVPVRICGVATVREADGLAMSSRNARLSADERVQAVALYRALERARQAIEEGATDASEIKAWAAQAIPGGAGLELEYLELVDAGSFQPVARVEGDIIAAGALWVGSTRLIDNVRCRRGAQEDAAGTPGLQAS